MHAEIILWTDERETEGENWFLIKKLLLFEGFDVST